MDSNRQKTLDSQQALLEQRAIVHNQIQTVIAQLEITEEKRRICELENTLKDLRKTQEQLEEEFQIVQEALNDTPLEKPLEVKEDKIYSFKELAYRPAPGYHE